MGEVKTFQTIKLPLGVWQLVASYMDTEQVDFSEACARLIRHGFVRTEQLRHPELTV
jgi:hypothetical protein